MNKIKLKNFTISNKDPFTLVAGPCQIESESHVMMMAEQLKALTEKLAIPFIFKASFDKANRTSATAARGVGFDASLKIFEKIKQNFDCPIVTDIHLPEQCAAMAEIVDMLQIPAFLCRQTDLIKAACETGAILNIKKGQFLAPWDMQNVLDKCRAFGNEKVILCDRGTCFGYNALISDMRGLKIMADMNGSTPVMFDATHSVQQPGGLGSKTGGKREYAPLLARAALTVGIASIFIETHNDPDHALSDGPNMIPLDRMEEVLNDLKAFDTLAKANPIPAL